MKNIKDTRNSAETKLRFVNLSRATGLGSIIVQYSYKGKVKWFSTGIRVSEAYWNEAKGEVLKGGVDDVKTSNLHIKLVKSTLDKLILSHIQQHAEKPSLLQLESAYNFLKTEDIPKQVLTPVIEALRAFIEVKRLTVQPNSLKAYSALLQNLIEYRVTIGIDLHIESLNSEQVEAFQDWLLSPSKQFRNTTVERRIVALKKLLEYYKDSVIIDYKELRPKFKVKNAKNLIVVTLDSQELKAMEELDLSNNPRLERVRDLFLLQTWTGLRFCDIIRLSQEHIKNNFVVIDINKTSDYSSVPLFPTAKGILEKHKYKPLAISNQKYNIFIKEVCQMLASEVDSLNTRITSFHHTGSKKVLTTKPKWAWITSHSARRSFVTMCIEKGIAQHYVMKWSNHSDPRSFRKYQNALQGESIAAQQLIDAFA